MNGIGRYLRTAVHLEPGQLVARVAHEAKMRAYRTAPRLLGASWSARPGATPRKLVLHPVPPGLAAGSRVVAGRFRSGQVEYHGMAAARDDWAPAGRSRLWRYEHQYHAELVPLAVMAAVEPGADWEGEVARYVEAWGVTCPPVTPDAWEPYPVARRVLNWSLAIAAAPALGPVLASPLEQHLRFLASHLERHLRGNHLLCDAAALLAGGAVLEGGDAWREAGRALLLRETARQVLGDGGYAERTVQYHAIVLQDLLVAMALDRSAGWEPSGGLLDVARRMSAWLAKVVRADGSVPLLNDAAPDAIPEVSGVLALGRALGVVNGPWDGWAGRLFGAAPPGGGPVSAAGAELPDTGWIFVRDGGHELLFDHGPLGPEEQPGHGHSDGLGYELVWGGQPVVLDTGTTTYAEGPVRVYERSTQAHACATVDGAPPDELWGAFRVGWRARVERAAPRPLPHAGTLLGGSLRAPQGWKHRRALAFWPGRALVVLDRIDGHAGRKVTLHVPLAPGLSLDGAKIVGLARDLHLQVEGSRVGVLPGWRSSGFERPASRAVVALEPASSSVLVHAFLAPGSRLAYAATSCTIGLPGGAVTLPLDADGMPK